MTNLDLISIIIMFGCVAIVAPQLAMIMLSVAFIIVLAVLVAFTVMGCIGRLFNIQFMKDDR